VSTMPIGEDALTRLPNRYIWILVSFGITVLHIQVVYGFGEFLNWRGIDLFDSPYLEALGGFHLTPTALGVITGIVAIVKSGKHFWLGILAVLFALFSFLIYNP